MSSAPGTAKPTDNAFLGPLKGGSLEVAYAGALSFMRRRYSRDLAGIDVAVWGVPLDTAVTNRPGARFGPQAIRRASAILWAIRSIRSTATRSRSSPWSTMATAPSTMAGTPRSRDDRGARRRRSSTRTYISHARRRPFRDLAAAAGACRAARPVALVQFDAHQDTWDDDGERLDHGSFVARAVRAGVIDPARSIQVGIRTHAPEDCGIAIVDAYTVHEQGVARRGAHPGPGRWRCRLPHGRYRLPRPGICARHGHTGCGRARSAQLLMMLRGLGGVDWRGMDVVEVAPAYDHADITAIAAAAVVQHYLGIIEPKLARGRALEVT